MTLHLNRRVFGRRWPRRLVLNSPSCKAVVNKTHVTASTFYNGCGTTARYTLTSIIYSNTLRTLPPRNALISRTKKVLIPFKCEFLLRRRSRNRIHFIPIKLQKSESVGLGRYTRVLKDGSYVEVDTSRNYSVVLMTQRYRRLNVKLVPFFCYATPLSKKYSQIRFPLIEKGYVTFQNIVGFLMEFSFLFVCTISHFTTKLRMICGIKSVHFSHVVYKMIYSLQNTLIDPSKKFPVIEMILMIILHFRKSQEILIQFEKLVYQIFIEGADISSEVMLVVHSKRINYFSFLKDKASFAYCVFLFEVLFQHETVFVIITKPWEYGLCTSYVKKIKLQFRSKKFDEFVTK